MAFNSQFRKEVQINGVGQMYVFTNVKTNYFWIFITYVGQDLVSIAERQGHTGMHLSENTYIAIFKYGI